MLPVTYTLYITLSVEETAAEPVNDTTQNEIVQNKNMQTEPEKSGVKQIHVAALVVGILSIVFALLFPIAGDILAIIGIVLSVVKKKEYRTTASLVCSIIGLVVAIINQVLGALLFLTVLA